MIKIGVLGAGTWGIALARLLAVNGHDVTVWSALPDELKNLRTTHRHPNLPGMILPGEMHYTADMEEICTGRDLLVFAVPSVFVRSTVKKAAPFIPNGQLIVDVAKGIEEKTLMTMSEVIEDCLAAVPGHEQCRVVALSGPTHAEEVACDMPTLIVASSPDEQAAKKVQKIFNSANFRVYTNSDRRGVELGGAVKNVVALAVGMDPKRVTVAGRYFQDSAYAEDLDLNDPAYTTPLGITISAGLGLISDSYRVQLNGAPAKLFRGSGISAMELLMMNGYRYSDLIGRSGRPLSLTVDGQRKVFYGEPGTPAELSINGAAAQPSAPVHAEDTITFIPARAGADRQMTAGALAQLLEIPGLSRDGALLPPDAPLRSGDRLEAVIPAAASVPPSPPPGAAEQPGSAIQIRLNGRPLLLPPKPDGAPHYLMDLLERSGLDFQHLEAPVSLLVNGKDAAFQQVLRSGDTVDIRKNLNPEASTI